MKIAYSHLSQYIEENPTIEQISDSLFQLGHEHEIDSDIFDQIILVDDCSTDNSASIANENVLKINKII